MKLLLILLTIVSAMIFTGCSQTTNNTDTSEPVSSETAQPFGINEHSGKPLIPAEFVSEAQQTSVAPSTTPSTGSKKNVRKQKRFDNYDGNDDGEISQAEMEAILAKRYEKNDNGKDAQADAKRYIKKHDKDGDKVISAEEFGVTQ